MQLIHRTSNKHRKLRWTTAVTVASAALALPAVAGAQVTVSGYPVSSSLAPAPSGGISIVEPAIAPAPDGSDAEWFVVSGTKQWLLSISPTGQQSSVANGLASDDGHAGQLCERRRRRLRLGPRQRPGTRERAVCGRRLGLAQPRPEPGGALRRLRPGHDARSRRRALRLGQRRHHPVPDHRRAVRELLDGRDPAALLHGRGCLRDRRRRQRRLVHRRSRRARCLCLQRLQRSVPIERRGRCQHRRRHARHRGQRLRLHGRWSFDQRERQQQQDLRVQPRRSRLGGCRRLGPRQRRRDDGRPRRQRLVPRRRRQRLGR